MIYSYKLPTNSIGNKIRTNGDDMELSIKNGNEVDFILKIGLRGVWLIKWKPGDTIKNIGHIQIERWQ
jgi:hypothetical protein